MNTLSKVLPIYICFFLANIWFSLFNVTFWLSRIKTGVYKLPFFDKIFETWWGFTLAIWCFNAIFCYMGATLLVARAYKTSVDNFGVLMSAFVISQIVSTAVPLFFICTQTGEMPNRQEFIALGLILIASLILANSRS